MDTQFQIKSDVRTAYRNVRDKDHDRELVQFGEICLFRNHDADETTLELQWKKQVCAGKTENTDESILLTARGALMHVKQKQGLDSTNCRCGGHVV